MGTIKGKPRGHFDYVLAADCETTGLFFNEDDPSYNSKTGQTHQSVSWGFIVADAVTLKPIEKLYIEIKYNGTSEWNDRAFKIHGLSKEYLAENGMSEEDAAAAIANLIIKYWGPTGNICLLGHNVVTFDMWFLKRLMRGQCIELKFGNRHIDTFSLGQCTIGIFNSDDLFDECGLPVREKHNALEDIEYTLESARRIKMIFRKAWEE
jgi:DNA polymerase III epsilon subunit-like protein